jgi:hypothetical protein
MHQETGKVVLLKELYASLDANAAASLREHESERIACFNGGTSQNRKRT